MFKSRVPEWGVAPTKSCLTYEARMPSKCPGWVRTGLTLS